MKLPLTDYILKAIKASVGQTGIPEQPTDALAIAVPGAPTDQQPTDALAIAVPGAPTDQQPTDALAIAVPGAPSDQQPVQWHMLSSWMEDNMKQLREAINQSMLPESWMVQYMQHMHDLEYTTLTKDVLPPEPSIEQLSFGGLVEAC